MKNFFLITSLLFALLFSSCKEESMPIRSELHSERKFRNGRIVFKSTKDLNETIKKINSMKIGSLNEWGKQFNPYSYFEYLRIIDADTESMANDEFYNFPVSHQLILNKTGEFQINDTIVWYHNGIKHFIPNANESLLKDIKKDPSLSAITGKYFLSQPKSNNSTLRVEPSIFSGTISPTKQLEFYKFGDSGHKRKYVNEIYIYTETMEHTYDDPFFGPGYDFATYIYLRIKLEWRGRRNWKPAGDPRNISYSVTFSGSVNNVNNGSNGTVGAYPSSLISYTDNLITNSNYDLHLASAYATHFYRNNNGDPKWNFELTGEIYQYITDDTLLSNAWTWNNNRNPLW